MYADIAVPSYKGPNADSFTYEVPKGVEPAPGQLVTVPFGRKKEIGIILSTVHSLPSTIYKLKPIDSIAFKKPFLLPYQLELLDWMAKYYLATKNNCANAILPELPHVERLKTNANTSNLSRSSLVVSQTLVLVPTINNIPQTMALFPKATNPVVYHSDLKPQEKLTAWLKVLSGQADFIFGTRQAVFFPFPKLKKIIILNEHDDAYKDQRSPYYDTLTVAEKISHLTKAELQIVDSAPRVTTYFLFKGSVTISSPGRLADHRTISSHIISMIDERKAGNKTAFSDELKEEMTSLLKIGGNILLYLNKKKESGTLYCNSCHHQEALPKEPQQCPNCKSPNIFFASLNVNSLAKTVRSLFPKAKINIIADSKTTNHQLPTTHYQIDIATSAVFYRLLPKHYDLVAAITIDSILNQPEFSAPEKAYTQLVSLRRLATRQFIVQTYQVDNPVLKHAAEGNYQAFYQSQISERRALAYPPYALFVKIILEGKEESAEDLAQKIKYLLPTTHYLLPTTLLGPFEPFFRKKKATYNIVVKIPLKTGSLEEKGKSLAALKPALESANAFKLAKQVIVDPASLN